MALADAAFDGARKLADGNQLMWEQTVLVLGE
jgi:hypothetical protein